MATGCPPTAGDIFIILRILAGPHVLLVQAASPPPVQAASPSIPLLSLLDLAPLLKLLPLLSDIGTVGTVEILPLPRHPPAPAYLQRSSSRILEHAGTATNSATFCRAKLSVTYPALRTTSPRATCAMMHKMVAHAMILEILKILTVRGVCVVCARASLAMTPIATG